jgi:hypothetical protein
MSPLASLLGTHNGIADKRRRKSTLHFIRQDKQIVQLHNLHKAQGLPANSWLLEYRGQLLHVVVAGLCVAETHPSSVSIST